MQYNFKEIEPKWQQFWAENHINEARENHDKPKYYILDMFPYPSGAGLHIGHPEGYTATDIVGRYKRMRGFNVLHPMGFDAFGLPTEQYSMKTGIHPRVATERNVKTFKEQLNMLGFAYDWSREINTTDPKYFKWTQWMFSLIYNSWYDHEQKRARHIDELPIPAEITSPADSENYRDSKRLAFIAMIPVNWCEALGTVLANEEVDEWREKGFEVERRPMRQWMLRITEYAERLLDDLDLVDWPHSTKEMQKNWIGRSDGAEINFGIQNKEGEIPLNPPFIKGEREEEIPLNPPFIKGETDPVSPFEKGGRGDFPVLSVKVFTTRPDTIFGASYLVLAPEHPLVAEITTAEYSEQVNDYIKKASVKSDLERAELAKEKTGIFTGAYAINPANKKLIPIWIADYVLAHYGTGAIMAVPAHDSRDFEFARAFNLPIPQVLKPVDGSEWNFDEAAFVDDGIACNSSFEDFSIDGLGTDEAIQKAIEWVENSCIGKGKVQYKLRDWLFSRQRYWGEPIPIMFFEDGTRRCLDTDELPLVLPDVKEFKPAGTGESPLATVDEWVNFIDKKTGKHARFETNTMPQWAGSCWYYLRYLDPNNSDIFCSKENDEYWMSPGGVDLYMGGAEHAVLHLLYARFWHKLLFDYGYVSTVEPFKKLYHQGLILGEDGRKMSKSLGNVVNPDIMVAKYGADALRIFEMFLGPLADSKPWSEKGMEGTNRFLNRVWRLIATEEGALSNDVQEIPLTADQEYHLNCTIKKVGEDIEELHFNTAVSQMMIFVNEFTKADIKPHAAMEKFVLCLAPFAPHIAEELWGILGKAESIVLANYPEYDPAKTIRAEVELVVQVTSKIRAKIQVPLDLSQGEAENIARADEKVAKYLEGNQIKKIIYVKNKIINFIV